MDNLFEREQKVELVRTLIDNTPIAYVILDDRYRIHYMNESFMKLRNLDPATTIGNICFNISNNGVHCANCAVEKALVTGKMEFLLRRDIMPDGTVRSIDDYAIPLKSNRDGQHYVLELMVDRTKELAARDRRNGVYEEILSVLSTLLDAKDAYTATHSSSVHQVSLALANAMGLPRKDIFEISIASTLHDIGKVMIPDAIINKPGKLTDEEFGIIKSHPSVSYDMLSGLSSFETINKIVRGHHERFDGRGYPDGLAGDDIPLGARIVAVADTYDAMTSTRSYRKALSHEVAIEEILRVSGSQLDPEIAEAFSKIPPEKYEELASLKQRLSIIERTLAQDKINHKSSDFVEDDFRRLVDEDLLLQEIFENTPCGYVVMDMHRNVRFASNYFLKYIGSTEEAILGKPFFSTINGGEGLGPNNGIDRAISTLSMQFDRVEAEFPSGKKICDGYALPLFNPDGTVDYIVGITIDRAGDNVRARAHGRF